MTDAGPRAIQPERELKNGKFALDKKGRLDWVAINNFGHRGIHLMTLAGKAITNSFYGRPATKAYFSGCSTGGRQAISEAQKYPSDYDGILAAAPGINAAKYIAVRIWGQLHMELFGNFLPKCKLEAVTRAVVIACDLKDGVIGGFPSQCQYDPDEFIGSTAENCETFTEADADIVRKIWAGPSKRDGTRKWAGFSRGTPLDTLHSATKDAFTGKWQTSTK